MLPAAREWPNTMIAAEIGVVVDTVRTRRGRFAAEGLAGWDWFGPDYTARSRGDGALGNGDTSKQIRPAFVCAVGTTDCAANPLRNVAALAAGENHSIALLTDGTLLSWGGNEYGQLGHFRTGYATSPMPVCAVGATDCVADPLDDVTTFAVGGAHTVARRAVRPTR